MRATHILVLISLLLLFPMSSAVISSSPDLSPSPAPPPTAGGDFSPSPSHGWGWVSSSPASNGPSSPVTSPLAPKEGSPPPVGAPESGDGIPFLSSNPAVPLPTGTTDTASIRPLPTPGDGTQAVGMGSPSVGIERGLLLVLVMMCSALGLSM